MAFEQEGSIGKYKIKGLIAHGGFSSVYLADYDGTEVAIKIPKGVDWSGETVILNNSNMKDYKKEALLWAHLTEETPFAVIRLIETGTNPFPWFAMEKADGSLQNEMQKLTLKDRISIMLDLLKKLDSIHSLGIIHKDIKPANILKTQTGWKFTDFGLSKVVGNNSITSMTSGTPGYMAPEQLSPGQKFGSSSNRTDIWAMGVLLYEMMTGKMPFEGESFERISMMILFNDPTKPSTITSEIPKSLDKIIMKAISKNQYDRYASSKDMITDLVKVQIKQGEFSNIKSENIQKKRFEKFMMSSSQNSEPKEQQTKNGDGYFRQNIESSKEPEDSLSKKEREKDQLVSKLQENSLATQRAASSRRILWIVGFVFVFLLISISVISYLYISHFGYNYKFALFLLIEFFLIFLAILNLIGKIGSTNKIRFISGWAACGIFGSFLLLNFLFKFISITLFEEGCYNTCLLLLIGILSSTIGMAMIAAGIEYRCSRCGNLNAFDQVDRQLLPPSITIDPNSNTGYIDLNSNRLIKDIYVCKFCGAISTQRRTISKLKYR